MPVLPGAEPYWHDGGPVGVLLCHGFTGSPYSLRPWAEHFAAAGYTVSLPRLPGHGTSWREANLTRWEDWYAEVDRAYRELRGNCDQVAVAALSMGGALALMLAQRYGPEITALVLVNPSVLGLDRRLRLLPVLRYTVASIAPVGSDIKKDGVTEGAYDRTPVKALYSMTKLWAAVRKNLAKVHQPLLLFRSRDDHIVESGNVELIRTTVSSADVDVRQLDNSYHVAVLDHDAPLIFAESVEFIARHAR